MRNGFVCKNSIVIFLVVLTTVDAAHLFYLPLPKIRSSNNDLQTSINEENLVSNEYLPLSALENSFYDEQQEGERRDYDDWEPLFAETSKHHIMVNERSHENQKHLDDLLALSRKTDKLNEKSLYDSDDAAIDQLSQSNTANQDWSVDNSAARTARLQSDEQLINSERSKRRNDALFLAIVAACSLVGVLGLVAAAIFWYKIQKRAEAALDSEYPSYGVTGPGGNGTKISPSTTMSDRKLAQSAQMFHYQQQRQQMMAQEKAHLDNKPVQSDDSDDEIPNGGDYTVYECPGLAPTGEMEVRNPLFAEPDSSPNDSHPTTNNHYPQLTSSSPPKEKSLP